MNAVKFSLALALGMFLFSQASTWVGALENDSNAPEDPAYYGIAGPVIREGSRFEVEGTARRSDGKACIYAASRAFAAAWNSCDSTGFANCDGTRPTIVEKTPDFCHVRSVVTGS